jgi:hypothetical protein
LFFKFHFLNKYNFNFKTTMKSRPMSATSASSSFGNFKKSANLEVNPKVSHYHSNGTGRDGYINFSNGGFRKTWENNYNNVLTCM